MRKQKESRKKIERKQKESRSRKKVERKQKENRKKIERKQKENRKKVETSEEKKENPVKMLHIIFSTLLNFSAYSPEGESILCSYSKVFHSILLY